jgi:DnaJ-class molecular chaperone
MDPYGYRAIICPGCDGACLWGEGRIDECDTCRGRGVVALRFRLS